MLNLKYINTKLEINTKIRVITTSSKFPILQAEFFKDYAQRLTLPQFDVTASYFANSFFFFLSFSCIYNVILALVESFLYHEIRGSIIYIHVKYTTSIVRTYYLVRGQFSTKWPCKNQGWMFFKVFEKTMEYLICNHYSRKVVQQTQILFWSTTFLKPEKKIRVCRTAFLQPEKRWIYFINPPVFLVNHFSRTRKKNSSLQNHFSWTRFFKPNFLNQIFEPDFSNQISKYCKNWGRRIKGCMRFGAVYF